MTSGKTKRTLTFVNWAHALDHFVLLLFPTAVIAIAEDLHRDYSELIPLSTGAFVAFGFFALPVGWLADRFGRRAMLRVFFFGYGAACLLVAASTSLPTLAASLLLLGIFSAVYHPIGSSIVVANATKLGRALGINAVWGNMGAALASGIAAALAVAFGWRAAFIVPGIALIVTGLAFSLLVKDTGAEAKKGGAMKHTFHGNRNHVIALIAAFMTAVLASGLTFNIVTIAMPKIIEEWLGLSLPLALTGGITTAIFVCGALTQILAGQLIDRFEPTGLFAAISILQPVGLVLAALTTGVPMAIGLVLVTAAIYGQIVVNDAMVGRYVPDEYRNRFYSWRFFIGFTAGGLAVPIIGALHAHGGFRSVLLATAGVGAFVFASAVAAWSLTRGRLQAVPAAGDDRKHEPPPAEAFLEI